MENKQANEKLMTAVINGDIEAATEAIIDGADIHQKTTKGNNLLYVAASRLQEDMFDWLLEVEVKDKKIDLNTRNTMGGTTLYELVDEDNFTSYIGKLLEAGANPNITLNEGISPLIQACADKKFEEVELLVAHGADINYAIPDTKTTAFLMAASQGSFSICELLKEKGADVNAVDSQGKNALITAIYTTTRFMKKREKASHKELCKFLCDIGIDLDYVAPSGMTALWAASINREVELVSHMLDKGVKADVWHEVGLEGQMSAMHIWANSKEVEVLKKLHQCGGKLGSKDSLGNAPESFGFLNPHMRETMLELNADVNAMYYAKPAHPNDSPKRVPVISQVINGGNKQAPVVKEMIARGATVTFQDEDLQMYEPIMMAIASSAYDIINDLLLTKQIDLDKPIKLNPNGAAMTPLMLTVAGSVNKGFTAFLEKKAQYEALVKAKEINDKNGVKSAIIDDDQMAAIEAELKDMKEIASKLKEEREGIFKTLVQNGADLNAVNENGHSAIFFANGTDYANWLKDSGADIYLKDKEDNSPLMYAVLNNKKELIEVLKSAYAADNHETIDNIFYQVAFAPVDSHMQQSLLEKGVINYISNEIDMEKWKEKDSTFNVKSINYQDEDGNSPLLVACARELPFLASLYIRLGADVNIKNANDETPLMHAIGTGNIQLVEYLIDKGSDVNAQTKDGKTILEFAEEVENKEILEKVKISLGHEVTEGSISGVKKLRV